MGDTREPAGEDRRKRFLRQLGKLSGENAEQLASQVTHRGTEPAVRGSYRALYDEIPLMCFTLDPAGRVLAANARSASELGYRRQDLIGRSYRELFHASDQGHVEAHIQAVPKDGSEVATWQLRKERRDGSTLWTQDTVRCIGDEGRSILLVVGENITERVAAQEEVLRYQRELRDLNSELTLAEERERRRIANGLHDQVSQVLAIAKLKLGAIYDADEGGARGRAIEDARSLLDEALKETRSLTFELTCPVLYRLGLAAALQDLGSRLGEQGGFQFQFESDEQRKPLEEDTQVILYRIVRELLFNVVKHARAKTVRVGMFRDDGHIKITLEDDGVGFNEAILGKGPTKAGGFGLFGIREKLDRLGGRLDICTAPKRGTSITVIAPLDEPSNGSDPLPWSDSGLWHGSNPRAVQQKETG